MADAKPFSPRLEMVGAAPHPPAACITIGARSSVGRDMVVAPNVARLRSVSAERQPARRQC